MLNLWSIWNRIIPKNGRELVKGLLAFGPQLQWSMWFREDAKIIEQWSKARGVKISQDQLLRETDYTAIENQFLLDGHILALCHAAALNAWDRIEEVRKKTESFTKIIQGPKETFMDSYTDWFQIQNLDK